MLLIAHIPQCYRKLCKLMGIAALCTCDDCDGKHFHLRSSPSSTVLIKWLQEEELVPIDTKRQREAPSTPVIAPTIPKPPTTPVKDIGLPSLPISTPQLVAKACIVCGSRTEVTHIGQVKVASATDSIVFQVQ